LKQLPQPDAHRSEKACAFIGLRVSPPLVLEKGWAQWSVTMAPEAGPAKTRGLSDRSPTGPQQRPQWPINHAVREKPEGSLEFGVKKP